MTDYTPAKDRLLMKISTALEFGFPRYAPDYLIAAARAVLEEEKKRCDGIPVGSHECMYHAELAELKRRVERVTLALRNRNADAGLTLLELADILEGKVKP